MGNAEHFSNCYTSLSLQLEDPVTANNAIYLPLPAVCVESYLFLNAVVLIDGILVFGRGYSE